MKRYGSLIGVKENIIKHYIYHLGPYGRMCSLYLRGGYPQLFHCPSENARRLCHAEIVG